MNKTVLFRNNVCLSKQYLRMAAMLTVGLFRDIISDFSVAWFSPFNHSDCVLCVLTQLHAIIGPPAN
jgi:hypothetical protein